MTGRRTIPVFAGPSIPAALRPVDRIWDWRPPAAAGDLVALLADPPRTLCLIDGYFDSTPAVWHKEILLLIERGVAVLGAASMGALRAAELAPFGMIGVGAVYRAYRAGRITGDDEVALVHGREEIGWKAVSEALVDVRATLVHAVRTRIVDPREARMLRDAARAIHFSERDWPAILGAAGCGAAARARMLAWLPEGAVALKQADALLCLETAQGDLPPRPACPPVPRTCFIAALAEEREVGL